MGEVRGARLGVRAAAAAGDDDNFGNDESLFHTCNNAHNAIGGIRMHFWVSSGPCDAAAAACAAAAAEAVGGKQARQHAAPPRQRVMQVLLQNFGCILLNTHTVTQP